MLHDWGKEYRLEQRWRRETEKSWNEREKETDAPCCEQADIFVAALFGNRGEWSRNWSVSYPCQCWMHSLQNQGSVPLNNGRIKRLCHSIALTWSSCWIYSVYTKTSVSRVVLWQSSRRPFFALVSTKLQRFSLMCKTKPAHSDLLYFYQTIGHFTIDKRHIRSVFVCIICLFLPLFFYYK